MKLLSMRHETKSKNEDKTAVAKRNIAQRLCDKLAIVWKGVKDQTIRPVLQPPQDQAVEPEGPRHVRLKKSDQGLGFKISGGEDGELIYVSQILPDGPAHASGEVRKGDVLLRVNDTDLLTATHEQAAKALESIPHDTHVRLMLQYRPKREIIHLFGGLMNAHSSLEYQIFEDKMERLRHEPHSTAPKG